MYINKYWIIFSDWRYMHYIICSLNSKQRPSRLTSYQLNPWANHQQKKFEPSLYQCYQRFEFYNPYQLCCGQQNKYPKILYTLLFFCMRYTHFYRLMMKLSKSMKTGTWVFKMCQIRSNLKTTQSHACRHCRRSQYDAGLYKSVKF